MTVKRIVAMSITGATGYVTLVSDTTDKIWNGVAVEDHDPGNWANYKIPATERSGSKQYEFIVPPDLPQDVYNVFGYIQAGAGPVAANDALGGSATLDWPGPVAPTVPVVPVPLGTYSGSALYQYVLRNGLVRPDAKSEQMFYDSLTDTVLELEQTLMIDEREIEKTITDRITVLGEFTMSLEPDLGLLLGVGLLDGNYSHDLKQISKAEYDQKFPNPGVMNNPRRPWHFCQFGGKIYVGPRPDKTTYDYQIRYSAALTSEIGPGTAVPFSSRYREVLKDGALMRFFRSLKNADAEASYAGAYNAGLQRVRTREEANHAGQGHVKYQGI